MAIEIIVDFPLQTVSSPEGKLVRIPPITMVYGTQITIVTGAYKPTYKLGASHCICEEIDAT